MKKTKLEEELENLQYLLTAKLEDAKNSETVKELLNEIDRIREMRVKLELNKRDNDSAILKTVLQMGIPAMATICLAVVGFAAEANIGNPSGFTLRWLFNRIPK